MNKKLMDKLKEGVSVEEVESFAKTHTLEVFATLAILIGAVSSMYDFFTGPKLTIFFTVLGMIIGVFYSHAVERSLKKFYGFMATQEKMTQFIIGGGQILISLILPFLLFGLIGLLAGTSYHYFSRQAEIIQANKPQKKKPTDEEHD